MRMLPSAVFTRNRPAPHRITRPSSTATPAPAPPRIAGRFHQAAGAGLRLFPLPLCLLRDRSRGGCVHQVAERRSLFLLRRRLGRPFRFTRARSLDPTGVPADSRPHAGRRRREAAATPPPFAPALTNRARPCHLHGRLVALRGSFANIFPTTADHSGKGPVATRARAGAPSRRARTIFTIVSSTNGGRPASRSYRVQPRL